MGYTSYNSNPYVKAMNDNKWRCDNIRRKKSKEKQRGGKNRKEKERVGGKEMNRRNEH